MQLSSALRSGITVASEVQPRRGYCWLKTFPNTPQKRLVIKSALQFLMAHAWAQIQIKTVKALKTKCCSDFIQTDEAHCGYKMTCKQKYCDQIPHWLRDWCIQMTQLSSVSSALRSGITVASEVHPRRGYCWLKTFPNTPQDGLKYSRLCNFWRSIRGPYNNSKIEILMGVQVKQ